MTFDEWLDVTRTFASVNYPDRSLESVRLRFTDGGKMELLFPDDQLDDSAERHPVEKAILETLALGIRVPHKELKNKVVRATKCSLPTFNRYLRRLKDDGAIDVLAEGYGLKER
jgi:hypothetical protein